LLNAKNFCMCVRVCVLYVYESANAAQQL